jgi:hypothetical protein
VGYPMAWNRVVNRNDLAGGYDGRQGRGTRQGERASRLNCIAGDLRRLEVNTRDARHLDAYARLAGVTPEQVRRIFDAFFEDMGRGIAVHLDYERVPSVEDERGVTICEMDPDPPIAEPYGVPWRT